jgi:DNA-binding beta-propeller fold protein YncE
MLSPNGYLSWVWVLGLVVPLVPAMAPAPSTGSPNGYLLVCNKADHTLGIVDLKEDRQVAAIPDGGITGHEVAASPDGRFAYVPIYGNSGVGQPGSNGRSISVIDLAKRERVATIDLGKPVRPHCAVMAPDGKLYVTAELAHAIDIIDPSTRKLVGSISTEQPESHMLVISHDGRRGYTANVGPGTVSVLDIKTRKPIKVIKVSGQVQRISITPDDRYVFTADQTSPRVAVIDTHTDQIHSWITLPDVAFGTRVTLDGKWLLATLPSKDQIAVIDLKTMKVARTIPVPKAPQEILLRPDGEVAYVSCDTSHQVAVIDLQSWQVEKVIETGHDVDGMAWAPME